MDFARWLSNSFTLTHGAYGAGCVGSAKECPSQLEWVTVIGGSFLSAYVTSDSHHKIDAFPFAAGDGTTSFVAGLDLTADGGTYAYDSNVKQFVLRSLVPFQATQSDLLVAASAQSFEPFVWKGDQYAVYELLEAGTAPRRRMRRPTQGRFG